MTTTSTHRALIAVLLVVAAACAGEARVEDAGARESKMERGDDDDGDDDDASSLEPGYVPGYEAGRDFIAKPRLTKCSTSFDLECGGIRVPLDVFSADERTITVAVLRAPARKPDEKIGALFVDLGGPEENIAKVRGWWLRTLPNELRDRFDVVTVDRRGVGESRPTLRCPELVMLRKRVSIFNAKSPGQHARDKDDYASVARDCDELSDGLLPRVGTERVAEDIDLVRAALGYDTISFYGVSYGTLVGVAYAVSFPERLDALVLDSVVQLEPTFGDVAKVARQRRTAERIDAGVLAVGRGASVAALKARFSDTKGEARVSFYDRCDRDPQCPAAPQSMKKFEALAERSFSLRTAESEVLSRPGWHKRYFAAIARGDAAALEDIAKELKPLERVSIFSDAVRCADGLRSPVKGRKRLSSTGPMFELEIDHCALLGIEPEPVRFSMMFPPKTDALVLTPAVDAKTPADYAVQAATALDARLVTWEGVGHGAFGASKCVRDVVIPFLVDGERPKSDVVCP